MGTDANKKYMDDILGNNEIIDRFGRNHGALILPPLVWEVVTPPIEFANSSDVRRGIRIEAADDGVYEITIKQLDDTVITTKLRTFLDYPWFIKGVVSASGDITRIFLAK